MSLVVILNYALTAEQPDPCGPEPYSPGKRPRTRSPLGEDPVMPRVPEEVALSQNSWGLRTSQGVPDPRRVPDPHILSGPLSREEPTPHLGQVRSRHMSVSAAMHAGPRGFPWKTRLPTAFNAVGGAEPDAVFAQLHCWSRVTKAHSAVDGATHALYDSLRYQLDTTARFRPL